MGYAMTERMHVKPVQQFSNIYDRLTRGMVSGAAAFVLGVSVMPMSFAYAENFLITGPAITTNDGNTLGANDTLTITSTGSITTSGQGGVITTEEGTVITNDGLIATTGGSAIGIAAYVSGGDVTIRGSGNISTDDFNAVGIFSSVSAGNASITMGEISTKGSLGFGIFSSATDGNASITAGDISTNGLLGVGIISTVNRGATSITAKNIHTTEMLGIGIFSSVEAGNASITAGNISTEGYEAWGILSNVGTGSASITAGNISTRGTQSHAIYAQFGESGHQSIFNDNAIAAYGEAADAIYIESHFSNTTTTVSNTGMAYSAQADAIHAEGAGTTITNSGKIIGGQHSVSFLGAGNTLNIRAGSTLQGLLDLGAGNTINIARGMNTAYAYEGGEVTIGASGLPHVNVEGEGGGTIVTVDPTGFSAQDEMLNDLTRVIADGVDNRLATARQPPSNGSVAMNGLVVTPTADATPTSVGLTAWAAGLTQSREQQSDGAEVSFDTRQAGLVIGLDGQARQDIRLGGFIGLSAARFNTDANSQSIDTDNYFGGLYAGIERQAFFLNLAVTAGVSSQSSDRTVANNMVAGGSEQAKADYDGIFISPSATLGKDIALQGAILTPSLRARYAVLSVENYEEHGTDADMSVQQRGVQALEFRGQLALMVPASLEGGTLATTVRLGGDATFASGDTVDAQILGQSTDFNVGNDDQSLEGFAGLDLSYLTDGGTRFFAGAEYGIGRNQATTAQADAGIELTF